MNPIWKIVWLLLITNRNSHGDHLPIEIVTGAYFEALGEVITYEKSIPIIYKQAYETKIYKPILETTDIRECNKNFDHDFCSFVDTCHATTNKIHDLLEDDIKYQYLDFINIAPKNKRVKRGLQFMGDFFLWCCNVVTTEQTSVLYDNQNNINNNYNNLKETILTTHVELINVTEKLNSFSSNINKDLDALHESMKIIANTLEKQKNSKHINDHTKNNHKFIKHDSI